MADLSIFKLDSETITIKDTTARQAAESAKTLSTTASGNATTALNKVNELESEKADAIISSASGPIASIPDGAEAPVKSLSVAIEPVQEGTGDPSPDNMRPISGWTGAKVTRTGKNLLDPKFYGGLGYNVAVGSKLLTTLTDITNTVTHTGNAYTKSGSSWNIEMDMMLTLNESFIGKRLKFSGSVEMITGYRSAYYVTDKDYIVKRRSGSMNEQPQWIIDVEQGDAYLFWYMNTSNAGTMVVTAPQIELGSTATAYEPYQSETYDITFPTEAGTVYGGTLDVTNGVLTVDRAQIASYAGETLPSTWVSDRDVYSAGATPTTGAQVVYELATPITYHLTPQEITTLLGQNNIWADTGDMSVTYRADTKLYIDNKIADLQALVLEN